ncbi:MAG: TadE/TadG family type IV pilus assembly protein [Rhizobiaceae bacterium]
MARQIMKIDGRRHGLRSAFARFQRDRDGATAIEFGILAIPFCLLLFAILESCISFAAQQVMSNVTDNIARQIRTGRLPAADNNTTAMKTKICNELAIIVSSCSTNLVIDLRAFDTYALAAAAAPIKLKGTGATQDIDETNFDVKAGGAKTKNMLRVFYRWPVMTDLLRLSMSNIRQKQTLLFATTTWKNEPF